MMDRSFIQLTMTSFVVGLREGGSLVFVLLHEDKLTPNVNNRPTPTFINEMNGVIFFEKQNILGLLPCR
jgi:hypothetical protein